MDRAGLDELRPCDQDNPANVRGPFSTSGRSVQGVGRARPGSVLLLRIRSVTRLGLSGLLIPHPHPLLGSTGRRYGPCLPISKVTCVVHSHLSFWARRLSISFSSPSVTPCCSQTTTHNCRLDRSGETSLPQAATVRSGKAHHAGIIARQSAMRTSRCAAGEGRHARGKRWKSTRFFACGLSGASMGICQVPFRARKTRFFACGLRMTRESGVAS